MSDSIKTKIEETLQSFEDACGIIGVDPIKVIPDFSCYPERHRKSMIAHSQIILIVEAANQIDNGGKRWVPDYDNVDEVKYEVWFIKDKSPSGFRFHVCDCWLTRSAVGSRLCFKSSETAEYIINLFEKMYNEYLL